MKLTAFITSTIASTVRTSDSVGDRTVMPSRPDRQRDDLHALPGEQAGREDLPGELGDPVEVPDVVGDARRARS